MEFAGELVSFSTAVCWALGVFPFTQATRRLSVFSVNNFRLLLASVLLGLLLFVFNDFNFSTLISAPSYESWFWLGLSGLIGLTFGDYFLLRSFAILGPRMGSIFFTLAPAVTLVLGALYLNEKINWIGVVGMAITAFGIIWVSLSRKDRTENVSAKDGTVWMGILAGILGAIGQGGGIVLARFGMSDGLDVSPMHYAWMRISISSIVLMLLVGGYKLIFKISGKESKQLFRPILKNQNNGFPYLIAGTMLGPVIGVSLSMVAISLIETAVAQTIFSLVPVFVILFSYLFFKGKLTVKMISAAVLAVLGVVVLIWRDFLIQYL